MPLLEMPVDLVLNIADDLQLHAGLQLTRTCRAFARLRQNRGFWIALLKTAQKERPLVFCDSHTQLFDLSLEKLRNIALSSQRLTSCWLRSIIRPKGKMTVSDFGDRVEIVATIRGTGIVILHMPRSQLILCWRWDVLSSTPHIFPLAGSIIEATAPHECSGATHIGILAVLDDLNGTMARYIVTVGHSHNDVTSFTVRYTMLTSPTGDYFQSIFLTESVIGIMVVEPTTPSAVVQIRSLAEHRLIADRQFTVQLAKTMDIDRDQFACFSFRGHAYTGIDDGQTVTIYHISRRSLAAGQSESRVPISTSYSSAQGSQPFRPLVPHSPLYGIAAAFMRLEDNNTEPGKTIIVFLPARVADEDDQDRSPLVFPSRCQQVELSGQPSSLLHAWMDGSGRNVLLGIDAHHNFPQILPERAILLVRYHDFQDPTVHVLYLPGGYRLHNISSIAVDESMGVVHFLDDMFNTLNYLNYT